MRYAQNGGASLNTLGNGDGEILQGSSMEASAALWVEGAGVQNRTHLLRGVFARRLVAVVNEDSDTNLRGGTQCLLYSRSA